MSRGNESACSWTNGKGSFHGSNMEQTHRGLGTAFCQQCRQFPDLSDSASTFVNGMKTFRHQSVITHDKSEKYRKCMDAHEAREAAARLCAYFQEDGRTSKERHG